MIEGIFSVLLYHGDNLIDNLFFKKRKNYLTEIFWFKFIHFVVLFNTHQFIKQIKKGHIFIRIKKQKLWNTSCSDSK